MGFNYRACGCRVCTRRAEAQEVQEFIALTTEFRNIMHANYGADEEANLRLLARRIEGQAAVGVVERIKQYGTLPPIPHPLEPPEGWCSA